ncbi:hypothetical protein BDV93DRAFT_581066 [Ceratobasidium sp. AG-I]|nr:hypothetical protein BDV93DRAFT_581066 [Ceratobasidium sp. AG-I]
MGAIVKWKGAAGARARSRHEIQPPQLPHMDSIWYKESKLVLGIDIGTTYSGATFVILKQGCKPAILRVNKWPGQDNQGQCSIPSLIWYTEYKKPALFGADALRLAPGDEDLGWQLAKHFKLHRHPPDMAPPAGLKLDPLPTGVGIGQIYIDFLRYIFGHAKSYFQQTQLDGLTIWNSLSSTMKIVIAHPNGWGVREQGFLRNAAVKAGLSGEGDSDTRISFVTEAEASLHFCLNLDPPPSFKVGMNLIVCDAGGSTVDITAYQVTATSPMLKLKEVKVSACVQAGSIFVDTEAKCHIERQIAIGGIGAHVDIDAVCSQFNTHIKPHFTGQEGDLSVKVGKREVKCPLINVQRGHMKIPGTTVKSFFDTCVTEILNTVASQAQGVTSPVRCLDYFTQTEVNRCCQYYFLVGGFGDNRYLQNELVIQRGISGRLTTNNDPGAKAVADGAAMWEVAITVSIRSTRYAFGTEVVVPRDNQDQEHLSRPVVTMPSGDHTDGGWSEIVPQGIFFIKPNALGGNVCRDFTAVCMVSADLQNMRRYLVEKRHLSGKVYWQLTFDICFEFGGTELQAFLRWEHGGTTMKGNAKVVWPRKHLNCDYAYILSKIRRTHDLSVLLALGVIVHKNGSDYWAYLWTVVESPQYVHRVDNLRPNHQRKALDRKLPTHQTVTSNMYAWAKSASTSEPDCIPSISVVYTRLGPELIREPSVGPEVFQALKYIGVMSHAPVVDEDDRTSWDSKAAALAGSKAI